jgi:chromate reductase, NAD(P)H dehydrogenase (quinone)
MRVLAFSGSLRKHSLNRGLVRAAAELAPHGVEIELYEIGDLPFYDGDLEEDGEPDSVLRIRQAVAEADAVLIATPEYNRGTCAVLKNAIDWLSRPARQSVLDGKPVAVMGASTGIGGTARAQAQLRDALAFPGAQTLPNELLVSKARDKFDEEGNLVDPETRAQVAELLDALTDWAGRVREAAHMAA